MAQSAAYASVVDNLFAYNPKSILRSNDSAKAEKFARELSESVDFVQSSSALVYNTRVRLNFNVEASLKDFIQIKGLIEFHRSSKFLFNYNSVERSIEADFPESDFPALKKFLENVANWFSSERQFKSALKSVIEFEAKYKTERELLYASIVK